MNIKPAPNLIFLTDVRSSTVVNKSGLYTADKTTKKTVIGKIASIGTSDQNVTYQEGQEILFIEGAGQSITVGESNFTLIRINDVIASI